MGLMKKASGAAANKPSKAGDDSGGSGNQAQPQQTAEDQDAQPEGAAQSDSDTGQDTPAGGDEDASQEQGGELDESGGGEQGSSPDGDADADDSSAQDTGQPGSPADDTGGGPAASENLNEIPAKPQQQAEYNKANRMLYQTLYQNTGAGNAVVKGIQPVRKIDSAVRLCTLLVDQIDKKTNMDQAIILPFTKDVVAHVLDVAEQVKGLQYSDDEANAVLGAALQAVMHIFGVTKQQANAFMSHMNQQEQQSALQNYHSALAKSKAAVQQGSQAAGPQQPQSQQGAQQSTQGAAPQGGSAQDEQGGGPGEGAGESAQGDDAGSAPAPSGGMMSQAEQAGSQEQQNG